MADLWATEPMEGPVWAAPEAWPRPKAAKVENGALTVESGSGWCPLPLAGYWRSLAELDPDNPRQVEAAALRFGPLAREGWTVGEPLEWWWRRLVRDLHAMAGAWTDEGEVAGIEALKAARTAGLAVAQKLATDFLVKGGRLAAQSFTLRPVAPDMGAFLRVQALHSLATLPPMKRCAHCGQWFDASGRRGDALYCSNVHRSAAAQKRTPPVRYWEV